MPVRLCLEPGCPNPATYKGRCSIHNSTASSAWHRNKPVYNTNRWRYLRRSILFHNPFCAIDGCERLATDVDHITPLQAGGAPYSRANLQPLCKSHHSSKTRTEQQGTHAAS